jgi:hypothetical protein
MTVPEYDFAGGDDVDECGHACEHCCPEILHPCTLPPGHRGHHDGHTKDRW